MKIKLNTKVFVSNNKIKTRNKRLIRLLSLHCCVFKSTSDNSLLYTGKGKAVEQIRKTFYRLRQKNVLFFCKMKEFENKLELLPL
jgi:hypothetical protein